MNPARFSSHCVDWCHLCGERRRTADVYYSDNAENDPPGKAQQHYVRICADCAWQILSFADSPKREPRESGYWRAEIDRYPPDGKPPRE